MIKPFHVLTTATVLVALGASVAFAKPIVRTSVGPSYPYPTVRGSNGTILPNYKLMYPHGYHRNVWMSPQELRAAKSFWTPVTASPPFGNNGAGTAFLMTDGTIMIGDNTSNYYRLTPDSKGSYINGTWSTAPPLPGGYGPLYFGSAVLPDGRLIVEGGEYNFFHGAETTLGAIYDPVANAWTSVTAPSGWGSIGDASSVVLPDGTFMLADCCEGSKQALLDSGNLTWSTTGTGKADQNSEEGWTLLPNGKVLTTDIWKFEGSELYDPGSGSWSSAGTVPVNLVAGSEIGAQVLRDDGTVFVGGATGDTAIYDSIHGKWKQGPTLPIVSGQQQDVADGPGALLNDGQVLMVASPGLYQSPSHFYVFNGKKLVPIPGTPNAPGDPSYAFRFLILPTGQVLSVDGSNDVEVFTQGGKAAASLAPKITSVPTTLTGGTTYTVSGTYLNGWTQGAFYGDDAQMATNYPLVRITNNATGDVVYAKTHDPTSMAVANKAVTSTSFDVPATIEPGPSKLEVVTNGIPSKAKAVTVV